MKRENCCILNGGGGSWVFVGLARQLATALQVDIAESPRQYNYLLTAEGFNPEASGELFIPYKAMQVAADKRLIAEVFTACHMPMPETRLVATLADAEQIAINDPAKEWCLKFPTGCGASGHRVYFKGMSLPNGWPYPLVMQEFVRMENPEVYRLYGAAGELFGWVARRFPDGVKTSPWVAHARGARYELAGEPPADAIVAAKLALNAVGLLDSFGCADLIQHPDRRWLVLEVGTDGMFNHVDREIGHPALEQEINERIANAFWKKAAISARLQ